MTTRKIISDAGIDLRDVEQGLTAKEVAERRERYGYNDIIVERPLTWVDLVRNTAKDPMIWFLVLVSILFIAIGDYSEAIILSLAIIPLVGMDAYLHRRTQASTQGLAKRLSSHVTVIRAGSSTNLAARELVPGDLIDVSAGEPLPADGIFVNGVDLQIDESSLTGEALPIRKKSASPPPDIGGSIDTQFWGFAGTRMLTGVARIRVIKTGGQTLYGEIARSALAGSHERTPLQHAVTRLVSIILVAALALCIALAIVRFVQGHGLVDALLSAAMLAIAALPEEFPIVFTFFLGVGVYRLARQQALVRRAVAVENIGRVTCICSDKTGTLTEGKLSLSHILPAQEVSTEQLVYRAALAARAESTDPLDIALMSARVANPTITENAENRATFPFTEDRRRETAIVEFPGGNIMALVKGAPETVFDMCTGTPAALAIWRDKVTQYASSGHKVIAVAMRELSQTESISTEPGSGYKLQGLLALEDPVREGVREAVEECGRAGIKVIMITGDHPATAKAIANDIGLGGESPVVILAEDLNFENKDLAKENLRDIDAIARTAPSQKLLLVNALKAAGEIVAVTGDGVNDVPALQAADIGIAMGERGTQSAREVAAIVLLDDNFRTVVRAIGEGRQLFLNLQLAFAYLLLIHIPFVLTAAIIPLADNPLLYLPIHIIWIELIIHPTAMLVYQNLPTSTGLLRVQKDGKPKFFNLKSWFLIGLTGIILTVIISGGFQYALVSSGYDDEHARSIALGILIASNSSITVALSGLRNWSSKIISVISLSILILLVQVPSLSTLVHLKPLHLADWGIVGASAFVAWLFARIIRTQLKG